jgi:hypothetical protein
MKAYRSQMSSFIDAILGKPSGGGAGPDGRAAAGALIGASAGGAVVIFFSLHTEWSFFWLGPIGILVTVIVGWMIRPLTAPNQ